MDQTPAAQAPARVHAAPMVARRKVAIVSFAGAVFLYWMALYIYFPTLSVYANSLTGDEAMVGWILAQYGLWQAIVRAPVGVASDWIGRRKPFIIVGFMLAGLGAWLMGSSTDANSLLIGRAVTGLAAGSWVPLVVVFSSLFPPEEAVRASTMLQLVGSTGRVLATAVTGTLNSLGGYPLAFFAAAAAAALALVVLLPAREPSFTPKRTTLASFTRLLRRADIMVPSVLSMVSQHLVWATTMGFMSLLAKEMGASDVMLSALVSGNVVMSTLGNLVATTLVKRLGARRLVMVGFPTFTLGIIIVALAPNLAILFVGQFLAGLSAGVTYPVLMGMSIRHVDQAERASAMGLHQTIYAIGMFSGPWLGGIMAGMMGIPAMFVASAVAVLLLGLVGVRRLVE